MLADNSVTEMACFDEYLDATPRAKTMRINGITIFLLHVAQCITFNQTFFFTATLISKERLKALYSRLGFKVIKDFSTYPNLEKACKRFNFESGKSKSLQKQTINLQCYLTIPRRVTFIHENQIDFNKKKMCSNI